MKRKIFVLSFSLLLFYSTFAQSTDPVVLSYQRNFVRASMSTKIELLNDASRISTVNMAPLYIEALLFVRQNYSVLGNDSQLLDIAAISANKALQYPDPAFIPPLHDIFMKIPDSRIRIACLNSFAVLAKDNSDEITALNTWFSDTLSSTSPLSSFDVKTLAVCATVLGKIGDPSSFPVLFRAATGSSDTSVVQASQSALNQISSGYTENILAIIATNRIKDMYAAFSFAMKKDSLPEGDRGKIAEAAFSASAELQVSSSDGSTSNLSSLITESMQELAVLKWSTASPLVVQYFYRKQGDFKNDRSNVDALIPVIRCMGAMGTTEAAQALSIFLGLLNSDTEQKKTYNEQLMLAVINALGDLGDKAAFDYLLYIGYLDYPETVKKASRDALARLQW